jgi:hypothetical protein
MIKNRITPERYKALKKACGAHAGWAVWGEGGDVYNPALIEEAVPRLHANYVFVGLNASRELGGLDPWTNYLTGTVNANVTVSFANSDS